MYFVFGNIKYYFVCNIDVYQGKNAGKIDIHRHVNQLPTKIKEFMNDVLGSNISDYYYGTCKLLLDRINDCPELFVIPVEEMNIIGGEKVINNKLGFPGDDE